MSSSDVIMFFAKLLPNPRSALRDCLTFSLQCQNTSVVVLHSPTLRTTFCFPDILLCTALNFSDCVIVFITEGVKPQVNLCFQTALVALNGLSIEASLKWRWSFCDTFTFHVPAEDNTSLGSSIGVSCSRVPKYMSRQVPAYKTGQLGDDWSQNRFTGTNTRGPVLSVTRGSFAVSDHTGLISLHQYLSFSVFCFSFLQKPILLTFSITPTGSHGIRICIKRKKIHYGKFFDFCAEKCVYN